MPSSALPHFVKYININVNLYKMFVWNLPFVYILTFYSSNCIRMNRPHQLNIMKVALVLVTFRRLEKNLYSEDLYK